MPAKTNERAIADVRSVAEGRMADPVWRAAFERMRELPAAKPATGFRLGRVTEEDKRGPSGL